MKHFDMPERPQTGETKIRLAEIVDELERRSWRLSQTHRSDSTERVYVENAKERLKAATRYVAMGWLTQAAKDVAWCAAYLDATESDGDVTPLQAIERCWTQVRAELPADMQRGPGGMLERDWNSTFAVATETKVASPIAAQDLLDSVRTIA